MNVRRAETPVATPVVASALAAQAPVGRGAAAVVAASGFDGVVGPRKTALSAAEAGQTRITSSILPGDMPVVAPGPLSLHSKAAKEAIATTQVYLAQNLNLGGGRGEGTPEFAARVVEVDALGMTHVRMDRLQDGLKVFGEQVIAHLDAQGNVTSVTGGEVLQAIPEDVSTAPCKCTPEEALAKSLGVYGKPSQHKPVIEQVLFQRPDGSYTKAFRVEVTDFTTARPERMNYMIDGQTGEVLDQWNQMGGIELPKNQGDIVGRPGRNDSITVSKKAEPNAEISDLSTVTSQVTIEDEVTVESLALDLTLPHTSKGDLTVSLTSPSGKTVVIHDRTGGGEDDVRLSGHDLSAAFGGEQAQGEWTLTVQDHAQGEAGTLQSWGLTVTGAGKAQPQGDDTTLYSGKVDVGATQNADGTFTLKDTTRGNGVETRDAQNKSSGTGAVEIKDNNNLWGEETDPARTKAAVDAQYGAQMTYDMYKAVLGRDSIDGKGEKLLNNVHIRSNYVNAFWDGKQMSYGDGDGRTSGPLTTLDIAGHEITHGLTERTAGLIYRNESGGINESMSDIMGTGVEWFAAQQNAAVKFDWTLGEDCWTPNNGDATDGLRYMNDPTKDRYSIDHYSNYPKQTEVHGSSGIMNNAFFLMAQGGTNRTSGLEVKDGIGVEKGLQIYGRALMFYMTPNTTFAQARAATVKAATDLFGAGSVEVRKVQESWTAVGVN